MSFEYSRNIFAFECDFYGHLNHANYLHLYEEARSIVLDKLDHSITQLMKINVSIYVKKMEVEFCSELKLGEEATVITEIESIDNIKIRWRQKIYNNNKTLCNFAGIQCVFIKNGRLIRLNKHLLSEIRNNIMSS